jgi:hypothetical protein
MRRAVCTLAAITVLGWGSVAAAEEEAAPDDTDEAGLGRAVLGAGAPDLGGFVIHGSLGAVLILPHLTAGVRAGLGSGFGVDVAYRNLAAFGHEGRFHLLWGSEIADGVEFGLLYKTAFSSLELADDTVAGIQFSTLPLANDWTMGNQLGLTFNRPGNAHITAAAGLLFTLGGTRFVGFEEKADGFVLDPAARAVEASIQGEWAFWSDTNVFVRLDAVFLLGIEKDEACQAARSNECTQLVPFGFIPTGTLGLAWAP